jgi:hypothetical protein
MELNTTDASFKPYVKPERVFEKSGVVDPESAYYVPLEGVFNSDLQDIRTMIDRGRYFSIFAPRQSGKTTFLKETCRQLHRNSTYIAILLSFLELKELDKNKFYEAVEVPLYEQILTRLKEIKCDKTDVVQEFLARFRLIDQMSFKQLFKELDRILQFKKIVILIDEFDGIPIIELANFLNMLRALYHDYKDVKQKALYSVGLIGIRNITKLVVGGVSPFNIADHINLPPFSLKNVRDLFAQYTEETNQPFYEEAVKKVHEETGGQTWLVNRLGTILTMNIKPNTVEPLDEQDVEKAIQLLLLEKNSHFENLYEKAKLYKETFVEIVFDNVEYNPDDEDQSWLEQYGLIKNQEGKAVVANNIYKARYIKTFFKEVKASENFPLKEYELPGNRLDMKRIIRNFNSYIAQIGVKAFYGEEKPYEKTGQFLLTAFLYQFSGKEKGELRYELRTGLGIMDIILTYKGRKYIIETKVNRSGSYRSILNEGMIQLTRKYLSTEAESEGYLVIFDTSTTVGIECKPKSRRKDNKKIITFIIGIGRPF